MAKRGASKELTHDNWQDEDEPEEMGMFKQASEDQLASRNIKKARRRGTNGEAGAPSVFKGLSIFSNFNSTSSSSAPPAFSFLNNVSKESSESSSGKLNFNTKSEINSEKTTQPLKVTQDSVFPNVKSSETKSKSFKEKEEESEGKKSTSFLRSLKALNEGVLVWIQKHLDKNPHVNLTPVFDDYKKHFSELLKKYPPELDSVKESEGSSGGSSSRKDSASGKENTPVVSDASKETPAIKPFSFGGVQSTTSPSEKPADSAKSIFTFGSKSSPGTEKKSDSTPSFSFSGFGGSTTKSEGMAFGSFNGSSSENTNSTGMFGGLNSTPASKPSPGGFSFGLSSSTSAGAVTEKKEEENKADEPSDEPPQVEVNEVKEDDALYEKKCKLFYMKDGSYVDRGVGTLYLKAAGEKTQLLVRAFTNLGNVLLNIILNSSIPAVRAGKNGVLIVCIPNPPLDTKSEKAKEPVKMLIRVKTSEDADALLKKIEEYKD